MKVDSLTYTPGVIRLEQIKSTVTKPSKSEESNKTPTTKYKYEDIEAELETYLLFAESEYQQKPFDTEKILNKPLYNFAKNLYETLITQDNAIDQIIIKKNEEKQALIDHYNKIINKPREENNDIKIERNLINNGSEKNKLSTKKSSENNHKSIKDLLEAYKNRGIKKATDTKLLRKYKRKYLRMINKEKTISTNLSHELDNHKQQLRKLKKSSNNQVSLHQTILNSLRAKKMFA